METPILVTILFVILLIIVLVCITREDGWGHVVGVGCIVLTFCGCCCCKSWYYFGAKTAIIDYLNDKITVDTLTVTPSNQIVDIELIWDK